MKKTPHKTLVLRIDPTVAGALQVLAEKDKRSMTNLAEVVLERYTTQNLPDYKLNVMATTPATVSISPEMLNELRRRDAMPADTDLTTEQLEAEIDAYIDNVFAPQMVGANS